ncbi:hypothetical protein [Tichowtungia aerotolerans]|uniref:Uncharacterized protein n=1 Tax=Tichowtungia aerotolerans TaxID=2697043 RepID=A0A6P1M600_9BACT|nr:hypothetical protein [Tichowtungia aerotolerans]QHI70010.1 hypothetical protein GT409_11310 [Tichowtungia aerotolerans]
MKCELFEHCIFFSAQSEQGQPCVVEKLKAVYCRGNPLLCARRRVAQALGKERVPVDLHPDHTHLVHDLIAAGLDTD